MLNFLAFLQEDILLNSPAFKLQQILFIALALRERVSYHVRPVVSLFNKSVGTIYKYPPINLYLLIADK